MNTFYQIQGHEATLRKVAACLISNRCEFYFDAMTCHIEWICNGLYNDFDLKALRAAVPSRGWSVLSQFETSSNTITEFYRK